MNQQTQTLHIVIAQLNFLVGDIESNTQKVVEAVLKVQESGPVDIMVFPELNLSGYPPEDLLYREGLYQRLDVAKKKIAEASTAMTLVVGYPVQTTNGIYNAAGVFSNGELQAVYYKHELPNYSVFDEKRYFIAGQEPCVFSINGVTVGLTICEDIWYREAASRSVDAGAQLIINLNASPFHVRKPLERETVIRSRVNEFSVPIIYANLLGGQDELVFDGGSFVMDANGVVTTRLPQFQEQLATVRCDMTDSGLQVRAAECVEQLSDLASVYQALVMGVRDYIQKNKFKGAVIGLSGGIDSALTLAIAVDAVGAENVQAVSMPSRYTADMSIDDAREQAEILHTGFDIIAIEPMFKSFLTSLESVFENSTADTTEENIQARVRGVLLMAISNKLGHMVLSTGNKSEVSVGYCTLYGDMVGGYAVLKDVSKTLVYQLANYCNREKEVIPQRVIDRPPSAELAPDQKDSDSLPDYDVLDTILELYVEQDACLDEILKQGFERALVQRIIRLVNNNEYKRRQAAPGVKISQRAFGRDRRYPITSGF
ncbi:NAD synthetase / Glutamine amidotransferase chain of NAD synthetase [hydrothermal vent metagenome]|uniref:NAD(+) synthase (glutamine-hydrolyzing) n=1 Tax=hydrothermal vent metagenome TaxID=652676 RepID=A0A3B0Y7B4_9ZZZZ